MNRRAAPGIVVGLILIWLAIEAGCYFASASMHITAWTDQGVQSVALLPPARNLLTGLIVFAILLTVALFARRDRLAWMAEALGPLRLLLLLAVPYVPYAVTWVPSVIFLAGPAKWIVIVASVAGCCLSRMTDVAQAFRPAAPGRAAVFLVSLAIFLALGIPFSRAEGPGGDEPHYLVLAHSLLVDRDIQIENNHRLRHYDAFVAGDLPMHYLHRGLGGVNYSVQSAGLPADLLPGYADAGILGAVVTVAVLGALLALAVFDLARLAVDRTTALLTWLAVAFTVPIAPHAWLIYPELPAALLSAWAALWIWKNASPGVATWIVRGAALSLWPWLHAKFLGLLFVAAACVVFKLRSRARAAAAFSAPIAASLALWLLSFRVMYGVASPFAQYGVPSQSEMALVNIPRGLFGLLFDYKFGVLLYSPIYLTAIVGAWRLLTDQRTRWNTLALSALALALLASVTPYTMWWGGRSAPARFIVPAIPFLVPMVASGIAALREGRSRAVVGAALAWSVCVFGLMALRPDLDLLFNERQVAGRLLTFLQGDAPISYVLPTFAQPNYGFEILKLGVWLVALTLVASGFSRKIFRLKAEATYVVAVGVVVMTTAGLGAMTLTETDRNQIVNTGRERLMGDYDTGAIIRQYPAFAPMSADALLQHFTLTSQAAGPFSLPPGRFVARIWLKDASREYDGTITLTDRPDRSLIATRSGRFRSPIDVPFSLPIHDRGVRVLASPGGFASAVARVEIEPRELMPRSRRTDGVSGALYRVESRDGAYVIYIDDSVFPEQSFFWTKGAVPGRVAIAPAGARRLRLSLTAGPSPTGIDLQIANARETLQLAPGETRVVDRDLEPDVTTVPVTVTSAIGFRPAAADPNSRDQRYLGCRVSVALLNQ